MTLGYANKIGMIKLLETMILRAIVSTITILVAAENPPI
jgi:hypothetical protein